MKLMCNVEVYNRLSALTTNSGRRKPQRSCIAIGRQSVKNDDIHILLQTQTNKTGTKYKVNNNIEKVFTKFINEGKATIRFKEPPHDINIQGDVVQIKSFLHVLKLGLSKKLDPAVLTLSNLNPKNITAAPKTKIVIKKASEYPVLQGFPRTTQELHLADLQRRSFDRQILKLQNLKVLNLSNNQLTSLPQELGTLPNLQELILSNNQLGKSSLSKWSWMNGYNISQSLRLLNLNSNQLKMVPIQISKLHNLISLYLSENLISRLPQGIGSLTKLQYLVLSKNNLLHLPGSMRNLQLVGLDISHNPFEMSGDNIMSLYKIKVSSLVDLAAKIVLTRRTYYDASIIPSTLVQYIDSAHYCMCGTPCFNSFIRKFMTMNLSNIAQTVKFCGLAGNEILADCYFCSIHCIRKYVKAFQ